MVTVFWIKLITLYQSFISPYKGFNCAHNARYKSGSCSNAVKDLIADKGFIKALPLIRLRFRECRIAYEAIQATPLFELCKRPCNTQSDRREMWSDSIC